MLKGGDGKILLDNWQEEVRKKILHDIFYLHHYLTEPNFEIQLGEKIDNCEHICS